MPMCDAYIPNGALREPAGRELLNNVTALLLQLEGVTPTNQRARAFAWVFVDRHEMTVGGVPAGAPHYKFACQVPEGLYIEERGAAVTKEMSEALKGAEGDRWPNPEARARGYSPSRRPTARGAVSVAIVTLPDIAEHVVGDAGRRYCEKRLGERLREQARALLEAAQGYKAPPV